VVIKSDLQSDSAGLEDATQMELEERLYDRLHVDLSDLQLLFCDVMIHTFAERCQQFIKDIRIKDSG
jgi:hypothetical protein